MSMPKLPSIGDFFGKTLTIGRALDAPREGRPARGEPQRLRQAEREALYSDDLWKKENMLLHTIIGATNA
jgi:hypothetical protein